MDSPHDYENIYMHDNVISFGRQAEPPRNPRLNYKEDSKTSTAQSDDSVSKMNGKLRIIFAVMVVFFIVTLTLFGVQFHWISKLDIKNIDVREETRNSASTLERNLMATAKVLRDHLDNEIANRKRDLLEYRNKANAHDENLQNRRKILKTALTQTLSELANIVDRQSKDIRILQIEHPVECSQVDRHAFKSGNESKGVFEIYVSRQKVDVSCDHSIGAGGWTVLQRRLDGSVNFFRNHSEYINGFGSPSDEHWLGLDRLYKILQTAETFQLRIDMEDWDGVKKFAEYSRFDIGTPANDFTLNITGYSGTAGDSLSWHNGQKFSTKDHNVDSTTGYCANTYKGAWWYRDCHKSNLNGIYHNGGLHDSFGEGVNWESWKGFYYSLKSVEMKLKPTL